MTVYSQNSYSANDRSVIASYTLPGGTVALRKGDVSVVLLWCANQFHLIVEPLAWPGNWGYAERLIRGSTTVVSNHASGTAIDFNAPHHPLGVRGTFSADQVRAIHAIVAACDGAVRWGGDYSGRVDEMHLEINAGAALVKQVADKIRAGQGPATTSGDDMASVPQNEWDQVRNAVGVLIQQVCGENSTLTAPWPKGGTGWRSERYGGSQVALTLVDYLREIDRQVNSRLTLDGRPAPGSDSEFGHLLSLRAEIAAVTTKLDQLIAQQHPA